MKVDNSIKSTTSGKVADTQARQTRGAGAGTGATATPQAAPKQDNVQITSLSSQLQALESSLADVSAVDKARVSAIKQAISEGRFTVNADKVADRLLSAVKELIVDRKK